jgi:uncharacterized glyoxalase superfamily protein PhnB
MRYCIILSKASKGGIISIVANASYSAISFILQSTYEELKNKGVDITPPEKQEWGGIMSKLKDQDGNSYCIISSPTSENVAVDSSS